MISFSQVKEKLMQNEEFRKEYERLDAEYKVIDALAKARKSADLTQEELAKKMGVKQSAVARLETNSSDTKLSTLFKYLEACGFTAEIKITPKTI